MIRVLRLFGRLRDAGETVEVESGATAAEVLAAAAAKLGPRAAGCALATATRVLPAGERVPEGEELALLPPVHGGATRQESVRFGLESLVETQPRTVLIHDAARPFVDDAVIERTIAALAQTPGAIVAVPVAKRRSTNGTPGEVVPSVGGPEYPAW